MILAFLHFLMGIVAAIYWVNRADPNGDSLVKEIIVGVVAFIFGTLAFVVAVIDYFVRKGFGS